MNSVPGPLGATGKTATFATTGGPLLIIVSGTAFGPGGPPWTWRFSWTAPSLVT